MTVRDVSAVAQRLEMVRRIATEIAEYVVELGTDGRLLALQLDELIAGVEPERELVVRDYVPEPTAKRSRTVDEALSELDALGHAELLELPTVARALGYTGSPRRSTPPCRPAGSGAGEGAAVAGRDYRPACRALRWCRASRRERGRSPDGGRRGRGAGA